MRSGASDPPPRQHDPGGFGVPWSPLAALWVYLLQISLVTVIGVVLGQLVLADILSRSVQRALILPASSLSAAAMTLLVVARRHPGETWRLRGPKRPSWRDAIAGVGYGIGAYLAIGLLLGSALQYIVTSRGGELPEYQQNFRAFAQDPSLAPIFVFSAVALAPIGEELWFRGMLFQSLRARLGAWPGIGLSALAFGFVHLDPTVSFGGNLLVFTVIFAVGMAMAWMFERTGTLVVPIVAHCTFNAISAVLLLADIAA